MTTLEPLSDRDLLAAGWTRVGPLWQSPETGNRMSLTTALVVLRAMRRVDGLVKSLEPITGNKEQ